MHPEQPANTVTRDEFERIWKHSVLLLQRGFQTGSILTVDAADAARMGSPWTRRYIYNHSRCGMCLGPVRTWDMATRTVYACESCQVRL
jgi:formamidopyrimidine-DNA glycosylase